MLDPHDTALDRLSKGANSTGLSVQDPFPRKVGLLLRNSERAESEKDSRNDTHSDQHRAPLKVNVQSQATSVPTVRKIDTYSSQCKNPASLGFHAEFDPEDPHRLTLFTDRLCRIRVLL